MKKRKKMWFYNQKGPERSWRKLLKKRLENNLYRFLKIILSENYSAVQEFFFLQPLLFENNVIIISYHSRELIFSEMLIKVLK